VDTFYEIINICEDKSGTIGDHFLAFGIGELRVEDIDILTFDLKSIVFNYIREIVIYIK